MSRRLEARTPAAQPDLGLSRLRDLRLCFETRAFGPLVNMRQVAVRAYIARVTGARPNFGDVKEL